MKIYLNMGLWFEDSIYISINGSISLKLKNKSWNTLNRSARKCTIYHQFNQDIGRDRDQEKDVKIEYKKL